MKLTWFGQTAFRLHIGGQIVVVDPQAAAGAVDAEELVSGADKVVRLDDGLIAVDGRAWVPRTRQRLLEAGDSIRSVDLWSLGDRSLLVDADEDMPLVLLADQVPALGRWLEKSVVVVAGENLAARAAQILLERPPRLIALAGTESEIDDGLAQLRHRLDGTGLVALEPGMAVEV